MGWTEQDVDYVRELAAQGHKAKDIGAAVGKTRNAVIGLCRRRNIPLLNTRWNGEDPRPKPKRRKPQMKPSDTLDKIRKMKPTGGKKTPPWGKCQFPYGDPHNGSLRWCARPSLIVEGKAKPYCPEHHLLTHQLGAKSDDTRKVKTS